MKARRLFRSRKSVLFVRPDYHCTFFYQTQLRQLGWRAEIFVPWGYPDHLLFRESDVLRPPAADIVRSFRIRRVLNHFLSSLWYLANGWKYEFHLYYGPPPVWLNFISRLTPNGTPWPSLSLAKLWGSKLIFLPTGCREELSKKEFEALDDGQVCGNCGFWDRCNDRENNQHFLTIRKYFDMVIGTGATPPTELTTTQMKWKAIDLELWRPNLEVPGRFQLSSTRAIRVLHSFSSNGRSFQGRNIKGSPLILDAIKRLKAEGLDVELVYLTDTPSNEMRFYQALADIFVEQLRYGWWGSTGVEALALGKPVICYLRESWKQFFLSNFTEYDSLPIVEADGNTIYAVLRELVVNEVARRVAGENSRRFAERHFDPVKNAESLQSALLSMVQPVHLNT